MAINFPTNPALNDTYTYQGNSWQWNGTAWDIVQASLTYTSVVNGLGYPPLSIYGGQIQGNLTVTGSTTSASFYNPNTDAAAFGYQALFNNTNVYNAAFGGYALFTNTSGYSNAGFGHAALYSNLSGVNNTGIGYQALYWNSIGEDNTSVGANSLLQNRANRNIAIGSNAGNLIRFGSNNVIIGSYTGSTAPISGNGNNCIVLADGWGTVRQVIDGNGNFGLGTTTPFNSTTTFVNAKDPVISQDGGYYGGGLYYDAASWRNTVASQGGWAIRNSGGIFTVYTGPANGAAGSAISAAERMRIDSSGRITMPYQPAFWARATGTQAWSGTTTPAKVDFTGGGQYITGNKSSGWSQANSRYTAPVAGTYEFIFSFCTQTTSATGPALLFYKNGAPTSYGEVAINYYTAYQQATATLYVDLAASDYVEFWISNYNASTFTLDRGRTYFGGKLIS